MDFPMCEFGEFSLNKFQLGEQSINIFLVIRTGVGWKEHVAGSIFYY